MGKKQQSGIMLLEAIIAILIFAIGLLGVIGIQASAIGASRDAKYRSDASVLANDLIGQMWSSDRAGTTLKANFESGGAAYIAWKTRVAATLPGVAANPPLVSVAAGAAGPPETPSIVKITVSWAAPNDRVPHNYRAVAQILPLPAP